MRIKSIRKAAGMTQDQLAEKLGVAQPTVCSWELGTSAPRYEQILKIREVFGCTMDELFASDDDTA